MSTWNSASLLSGWIPSCFQVPEHPARMWLCVGMSTWRSEANFLKLVVSSYCIGFGKVSQQAWQQAFLHAEPSHRLYFFSPVTGSSPLTGSQIPTPKCAWSFKTIGKSHGPCPASVCWCTWFVVVSLLSAQCPAVLAE